MGWICKRTYASVLPCRYTYGNYRKPVAKVDASDSRCRCIGKIIAKGLRLILSCRYTMAVARPLGKWHRSRAAGTLSPYLGSDLLGCIYRTRERDRWKERTQWTMLTRTYSYEPISPTTDQYSLRWLFGGSGAQGNYTSTWLWTGGGNNPCQCHLHWAEIQKSKEVWRREEKRQMKGTPDRLLSSGTKFRNSIDPFPPLPSPGPQFPLISTPILIRQPTWHPVPHSWFISPHCSWSESSGW